MTHRVPNLPRIHPLHRVQTMTHPTVVLRHHLEIVPEHKIVVLVYGSSERVLEGKAGVVAPIGGYGAVAGVEVGVGDGNDVGAEEFEEGFFGVGAWFALVGDADWAVGGGGGVFGCAACSDGWWGCGGGRGCGGGLRCDFSCSCSCSCGCSLGLRIGGRCRPCRSKGGPR